MKKQLEHLREPSSLNFIWHSIKFNERDGEPHKGKYFLIGKVSKANQGYTLRYLVESTDYKEAIENRFEGHMAFKLNSRPFTVGGVSEVNAMESFKMRLPARTRSDFRSYLKSMLLPEDANISDFALLGYTEGRLPSDGFLFSIDFDDYAPPFDFITEVSGFRYWAKREDVSQGMPVEFIADTDNQFDSSAIAIVTGGKKIGYVNRTQTKYFKSWIERGWVVTATVGKINGSPDRPRVVLIVDVR